MRGRSWLWIVCLTLIGLGFARLRLDVEILNLLPGDSRVVQGLKLYQENFSNARELILTVSAPDAELAEGSARAVAEALRARTNLVNSVIWQPPWLEHPDQAAELIAYLWLNQPPQAFAELTNRIRPDNLTNLLAEVREQLATSMSPAEIGRRSFDPFGLMDLPQSATTAAPSMMQGQEMFATSDGTFRLMFVQSRQDLTSYRACLSWLNQIKAVIETLRVSDQIPQGVTVHYTGRPAFVSEIAGGMERDMTGSVIGTAVIISILFWLAHRRWRPMVWLVTLLAVILAGTLALGGLLFGAINVVSLGFAAILLGLAVDYAVVHYQEALAFPTASIPEIRRAIAPAIFWAAVTTISAFLVLNFGGLPGLGQLGSLVAIGVALSAVVMIFFFLPPLFPDRRLPPGAKLPPLNLFRAPSAPASAPSRSGAETHGGLDGRWALTFTGLVAVGAALVLTIRFPRLDHSADPLRPRNSQAYETLEEIKRRFGRMREPLWILVAGKQESEVERRLTQVNAVLDGAVSNRLVAGYTSAYLLWPKTESQRANRSGAQSLVALKPTLMKTALDQGFTTNSLIVTRQILETWERALTAPIPFWPTNAMSDWILQKVIARAPSQMLAAIFVHPQTNSSATLLDQVAEWAPALPSDEVWLSGWDLLGPAIFRQVQQRFWLVLTPMICLVLLALWLAFHRPKEIVLSLATLGLSCLVLLAVMGLVGWSWNLLNLMALPLLLGTGVDYTIFMQLALRRHHGNRRIAYRSVGRALLLCGATAVAGFGSLGLSTNAGMASLGKVCAVGIACNMLISIYLLPTWWQKWTRS